MSIRSPYQSTASNKRSPRHTPRRRRASFRPALEPLEQRAVPSVDFELSQAIATGGGPLSSVAADFNGDGTDDLVLGAELFLANRDGTFRTPLTLPIPSPNLLGLVSGDFNNDGRRDVAVLAEVVGPGARLGVFTGVPMPNLRRVATLLGGGDGTFTVHSAYDFPLNGGTGFTAADFSGDGNLDLAYCTFDHVNVLHGNGNGTFRPPQGYAAGDYLADLRAGDVNGDRRPDLLVLRPIPAYDDAGHGIASGGVGILFNDGAGGFAASGAYEMPANMSVALPGYLALGDFNKDGTADLATVDHHRYAIRAWVNNGDGTFGAPTKVIWDLGSQPRVAVGDFNGDGHQDVAACGMGKVVVSPGNGDGTFQAPRTFLLSGYNSENRALPQAFGCLAGRFDGSGKYGLAVSAARERGFFTQILIPTTASTVTELRASSTDVPFDTSVNLTAVVSGLGVPAGEVTFLGSWGLILGSAPLQVVDGVAQVTLAVRDPTWQLGDNTVTGVYGWGRHGSGAPLSYGSVTLNVTEGVVVALSVSTQGNWADLSVRLASAGPIPAGRVEFLDGGKRVGSAAVDPPRGWYVTDIRVFLAPGNHELTAVYNGRMSAAVQVTAPDLPPEATPRPRSLSQIGLDPAFGEGGVANPEPVLRASPWVFAMQPDGKLLEAANSITPAQADELLADPSLNLSRVALLRQNPDGSPDGSFGTDSAVFFGIVDGRLENIPSDVPPRHGFYPSLRPWTLAVQADGKVLVAGDYTYAVESSGDREAPRTHFWIARFNGDGSIDREFGEGGLVVTALGTDDIAMHLALQGDGKIVMAGMAAAKTVLARYEPDGRVDTSFGGGPFIVPLGPGFVDPTSLVALPDGRILLAAVYVDEQHPDGDTVLARFDVTGALDPTFGDRGIVYTGFDRAYPKIAVQGDGQIIATCGFRGLAAFTQDGQLDPTFGDGGIAHTVLPVYGQGWDSWWDVVLQPDGKIVVVTDDAPLSRMVRTLTGWYTDTRTLLARYDRTGRLDPTFGDGGRVIASLGQGALSHPGTVVQPDGGIVVARNSWTPEPLNVFGSMHLSLARFTKDASGAKIDPALDWTANQTSPEVVTLSEGPLPMPAEQGSSRPLFVAMPPPKSAASPLIPAGVRPAATGADTGSSPHVNVFNAETNELLFTLTPFDANFTGGVRVAVGDVNDDSIPDILCAAGPGGGPNVVVFSGRDQSVLYNFMAFDPGFTGGVTIAAGDVNGDGFADIIAGADTGGGPNVSVFSGRDGLRLSSFFAYDPLFTGGVRVAAGNVMGTGAIDVIVGAGPGGGPHVTVFNGDGTLLASFFAYDPNLTLGITVTAGENDGDGPVAIITGAADAHVATFTFDVAAGTAGLFATEQAFAAGGARDGTIADDSDEAQQLDAFFAADPVRMGSLFVAVAG